MQFLVVVTPPYIYHGFSTRKMFWEEKFTGKKQDLFQSMNIKNCGCRKVRKRKEIKGSDKIVTLNVSAKFDSLNNMETKSSESKGKLGRPGKGLVTALALKTKVSFAKIQKGKVCHRKCQHEGPFQHYQRVWKNCQCTLCEKDPQTWAHFKLLSSSWVYHRVYFQMWWGQSSLTRHARRLWRRDGSVIEH